MNKQELLDALTSLSRNDLNDIMTCLLDREVLSIRDILELYERKLRERDIRAAEEINKAEGHIFELMYPCLYETKDLSEQSRDIIARALSFVDKHGLHQTRMLHDKLEE